MKFKLFLGALIEVPKSKSLGTGVATFRALVSMRQVYPICHLLSSHLACSLPFSEKFIVVLFAVVDNEHVSSRDATRRFENHDVTVIEKREIEALIFLNTMSIRHHWGVQMVFVEVVRRAPVVVFGKLEGVSEPFIRFVGRDTNHVGNNKHNVVQLARKLGTSFDPPSIVSFDATYFAETGICVASMI